MEHPIDFVRLMSDELGAATAEKLTGALEISSPVSIRLNPFKRVGRDIPFEKAERVGWCEDGRYLASRPSFTLDPLFHAGTYYVQEAASMYLQQVAEALTPLLEKETSEASLRVLDLCAAPGGKSTIWASWLRRRGFLVVNEPIPSRAAVLWENMMKWGCADVAVCNAYPTDFASLGSFFDIIAADVPCSGEGMFRKDPAAREEWSLSNVKMCAERQFSIVSDVWPSLKQGGYLVYSTCTFNRLENEQNIRRICRELGAETVQLPVPEGAVATEEGLHFYPHMAKGEGLFVSLLRKTADAPERKSTKKQREKFSAPQNTAKMEKWLIRPKEFRLISNGQTTFALRECYFADFCSVAAALRSPVTGQKRGGLLSAGIPLAEEKGRKQIPLTPLALSLELNLKAFAQAELSREQAIAFLRRESLTLNADVPRGFVLVCHEGTPLGFVNNLGNRANNLYPAEWRIRKQV